MDDRVWDALRAEIESGTQMNRMLHAETQRQLTKLIEHSSQLESRVNDLEDHKMWREGQLTFGLGFGKGAFKIGLVILAAMAAGFFGGNAFNETGVKMRTTTIIPEEAREVVTEPKNNPASGDDDE